MAIWHTAASRWIQDTTTRIFAGSSCMQLEPAVQQLQHVVYRYSLCQRRWLLADQMQRCRRVLAIIRIKSETESRRELVVRTR